MSKSDHEWHVDQITGRKYTLLTDAELDAFARLQRIWLVVLLAPLFGFVVGRLLWWAITGFLP